MAVYSEADAGARHAAAADEAVGIGGAAAAESYLNVDRVLEAARAHGRRRHSSRVRLSRPRTPSSPSAARRPGSRSSDRRRSNIRTFGLKHRARALAVEAGLPLLPGTGLLPGLAEARAAAAEIGYPVMLKSTAGGGGIGMRRCADAAELEAAFDSVVRLAGSHFNDRRRVPRELSTRPVTSRCRSSATAPGA